MKILVVDDNRALTEVVKAMLQRGRHRVETAGNGEEGYQAFIDFQPELVITDIQMPHRDGFALIDAIRGHNPQIRTIYMSGDLKRFRMRIESEKRCYAVDGLDKPFSIVDLHRALEFVRN
jgi:CheY-like chemotaxis protein